jgi:hypothetical protein
MVHRLRRVWNRFWSSPVAFTDSFAGGCKKIPAHSTVGADENPIGATPRLRDSYNINCSHIDDYLRESGISGWIRGISAGATRWIVYASVALTSGTILIGCGVFPTSVEKSAMNDVAVVDNGDAGGQVQVASVLTHGAVKVITGATDPAHEIWAPRYYWQEGCGPVAAVDTKGNTNSGLNNSGSEGGDCRDHEGQTYARSMAISGGIMAHMYASYFPKDNGYPIPSLGHRHDWECVIVFVKKNKVIRVAYSQHGDYQILTKGIQKDGTHVLAKYGRNGYPGFQTHSFMPTDVKGDPAPTIASWELIPTAARDALNNTDWGKAICPVKDTDFVKNIDEALQ